jgi:hypothetical protein
MLMQFVEFVEFLGRLADTIYVDEFPLHKKAEMLLDKLLPKYKLRRVPINSDAVMEDSEDSD